MSELPNAFVSPARIEAALNRYRCKRCGNFHPEHSCGGRTEWIWALAELLDYELRYGGGEPPKPAADPVSFADTCCGNCTFGTCYVDQMTGA